MSKKINVGIIFGGPSVEHEVSLQSAKNVIEALDRSKYTPLLIGIDKKGEWHFYEETNYLLHREDPELIALGETKKKWDLLKPTQPMDILFPVMHGYLGEDGAVQGLCKLLDLPFVGADVLGSAIGMDKDVMKRLLKEGGIPIAKFLVIHEEDLVNWPLDRITQEIPLPFFVKPSNGGSSIGIRKVTTLHEIHEALEFAFQFDRKVLIEEAISGREIQFSLLGNTHPKISLPCEIIPRGEFHSYRSKYIDPQGADFFYPAEIDPKVCHQLKEVALKAYKILCCEGMARVDLFLSKGEKIYLNEINTIPGLTNMSPYAKMWQASGVSYPEMLDQLITLALEKHQKEKRLIRQIELKSEWVN